MLLPGSKFLIGKMTSVHSLHFSHQYHCWSSSFQLFTRHDWIQLNQLTQLTADAASASSCCPDSLKLPFMKCSENVDILEYGLRWWGEFTFCWVFSAGKSFFSAGRRVDKVDLFHCVASTIHIFWSFQYWIELIHNLVILIKNSVTPSHN